MSQACRHADQVSFIVDSAWEKDSRVLNRLQKIAPAECQRSSCQSTAVVAQPAVVVQHRARGRDPANADPISESIKPTAEQLENTDYLRFVAGGAYAGQINEIAAMSLVSR